MFLFYYEKYADDDDIMKMFFDKINIDEIIEKGE